MAGCFEVDEASGRPQRLQVGTYNIYNTTARYTGGRQELLAATIHGLKVDVLGLQEVVFGPQGQTQTLLAGPGGWAHAFEAPLAAPLMAGEEDPTFRIDGNAFLVREGSWQVVEGSHETLALSDSRTAQRLRVRHAEAGIEVILVNTHLHWAADPRGVSQRPDAELRGSQMEMVLGWLEACRDVPTILVGDLNVFFPEERIHSLLQRCGFESAYKRVHGADCKTCPTPLEAPTIAPGSSVQQSCDFVLIRQPVAAGAHGAIRLIPVEASLAGDRPAEDDQTLFPSDHYAVVTTIEVHHQAGIVPSIAPPDSPAGGPLADLPCKLRDAVAALAAVPDETWPRVPVEARAVSCQFVQEWERQVALHASGSPHGPLPLNSYRVVHGGDGDWKTFDPYDCSWWCTRALTRHGDRSLVETLMQAAVLTGDATFVTDASGAPYFGTATDFFSYCWKAELHNVLSSVQQQQASHTERCFFWIDIFAVGQNQHTCTGQRENAAGVSAFEHVISITPRTVFWWAPWWGPETLRRVWCLYELLHTLRKPDAVLKLGVTCNDLEQMRRPETAAQLQVAIDTIHTAEAQATVGRDWYQIHCQIETLLHPESTGVFVPFDDEFDLLDPEYVPLLGAGALGEDGPEVDFADFDEGSSRGVCNGTSLGHVELDRMVRTAFRNMLRDSGVSLPPAARPVVLESPHTDRITALVAWSEPNGDHGDASWFAATSADRQTSLFKLSQPDIEGAAAATWLQTAVVEMHSGKGGVQQDDLDVHHQMTDAAVCAIAVLRSGGVLVADFEGRITVWTVAIEAVGSGVKWEKVHQATNETGAPVFALACRDQTRHVASGDGAAAVIVWRWEGDLGGLSQICVMEGHTQPVQAVVINAHTDVVNSLVFDHTANVLASASDDGTVRFWYAQDLSRLHEM
eukprot:gene11091-13109_t